jgi:Flp pilus assembly protein TadG
MIGFIRKIGRDQEGAGAVEFAIAAPAGLAMMVGIVQLGMVMQAYNALRSIAGDAARYTVVQYQIGTQLTDQQIEGIVLSRATGNDYQLKQQNLTISATTIASPEIDKIKQVDVSIAYQVPSFMPFFKAKDFEMSVDKSIYLLDGD